MELFGRGTPGPIERFLFKVVALVAVAILIRGIIAVIGDAAHFLSRVEVFIR